MHLSGSDKETNADLHFGYGMTTQEGGYEREREGGAKNGKSIANFLLFCIGIRMFAEIKVDKPERTLAPSQLEQPSNCYCVCGNS